MPDLIKESDEPPNREGGREQGSSRISVPEIARRLDIGRMAVYEMLEQGIRPGIRLGRRGIITWRAYEQWERTCVVTKPQQEAKCE
jgi:excisionase family DNA binding protein